MQFPSFMWVIRNYPKFVWIPEVPLNSDHKNSPAHADCFIQSSEHLTSIQIVTTLYSLTAYFKVSILVSTLFHIISSTFSSAISSCLHLLVSLLWLVLLIWNASALSVQLLHACHQCFNWQPVLGKLNSYLLKKQNQNWDRHLKTFYAFVCGSNHTKQACCLYAH